MTLNWKAQVVLAVLGAGVIGGLLALNNAHQRQLGAERILTAQARAEGKAARREADSLARVFRIDTLRLTRLRVITDTMTNTVESWKTDTVQVVRYVVQADSTIQSCTQALATCDALVGAQRRRAEAAETDARLVRRQLPSRLTPWRYRAEGAIAGAITFCLTTNCLKK